MQCPKCGLLNLKSAQRCDCGHCLDGKQEHPYGPVLARSLVRRGIVAESSRCCAARTDGVDRRDVQELENAGSPS